MNTPRFSELVAPESWATVDFISDIHLHAEDRATFAAWQKYLEATPADALFILGDLFEVWIGDDTLTHHLPDRDDGEPDTDHDFNNQCVRVLRHIAQQVPIYVLHGNRDFLLGPEFERLSHCKLIADPTVLTLHGQRTLLTHGDALCVDDTGYQTFRAQVRSAEWQAGFLHKRIDERAALARQLRQQSQAKQAAQGASEWAKADDATARGWLGASQSTAMIHGHTHQPGDHDLGAGLARHVLSDWDAKAKRLEVLRLGPGSTQRIAL
jgi:UDP-2,3-diacylglucosamine hydrolase